MRFRKKTSKEWLELVPERYKLKILDPGGWDRKNYEYSFHEELITWDEFKNRVMYSTISCRNVQDFFKQECFDDFEVNQQAYEFLIKKGSILVDKTYTPAEVQDMLVEFAQEQWLK